MLVYKDAIKGIKKEIGLLEDKINKLRNTHLLKYEKEKLKLKQYLKDKIKKKKSCKVKSILYSGLSVFSFLLPIIVFGNPFSGLFSIFSYLGLFSLGSFCCFKTIKNIIDYKEINVEKIKNFYNNFTLNEPNEIFELEEQLNLIYKDYVLLNNLKDLKKANNNSNGKKTSISNMNIDLEKY